MSNEDIAALGERISRLERVVATLAARANLEVPDLIGEQPSRSGFASDGEATGFASDTAATGFASVDAASDPQVLELIRGDDMIRAIKRYRELTNSGLAEAKDAVERIAAADRSLG